MTNSGQILIADDDETFLLATADLLRREGYLCNCASDAKTVTEMLRSARYDLLITDINMPGNTNLELIKELSEIVDGMPVILVTGEPSLAHSIQSVQPPVVTCLFKPFDFNDW